MRIDGFSPPPGLRNRHVQTMLSSGPLRRALVRKWSRELRRRATSGVLDVGGGVRLAVSHTAQNAEPRARGLLVVLHGWEGSSDSNYVLESGARALAEGWDVVRLNLRDHGGSHALNPGIFHSCRIDEAVGGLAAISARWSARPLLLAGFSLGGNFALRMAHRAPQAGIDLAGLLAVCPVVDPTHSLHAIEAFSTVYERYFMHKWRGSLKLKQQAFPDAALFNAGDLNLGLRELTRELVIRHTDFGSLDNYLDGYSIAGDRLAGLEVPARILTSRDDPVIPVADFEPLRDIAAIDLDITDHGGHCGFIGGYHMRSFCPQYLADWLATHQDAATHAGD
ncbi:MAG: alpha/beta fold hydrolase [Rhodanobacteraceae bacterium]